MSRVVIVCHAFLSTGYRGRYGKRPSPTNDTLWVQLNKQYDAAMIYGRINKKS